MSNLLENESELEEAMVEIKRLNDIITNLKTKLDLGGNGAKKNAKVNTFTHNNVIYRFTNPSPKVPKLLPFQTKKTEKIMPDYAEYEGQNLTEKFISEHPEILKVFEVCGFQIVMPVPTK